MLQINIGICSTLDRFWDNDQSLAWLFPGAGISFGLTPVGQTDCKRADLAGTFLCCFHSFLSWRHFYFYILARAPAMRHLRADRQTKIGFLSHLSQKQQKAGCGAKMQGALISLLTRVERFLNDSRNFCQHCKIYCRTTSVTLPGLRDLFLVLVANPTKPVLRLFSGLVIILGNFSKRK